MNSVRGAPDRSGARAAPVVEVKALVEREFRRQEGVVDDRGGGVAGAQGFLLKDAAPDDLREAILRVARGETLLQPVSTDAVRARYRYHADDAPPRDTFGKREVAILRLIAGGYSNREIARSLFLAEGTVKNYVSEILDKLGTRDRTRAVLKAITLRII